MFDFDRMKELCKRRGMKISYICSELGVRYTYFNDCKRFGTVLSRATVNRIATLLNTTPEYLCGDTNEADTAPLHSSAVRLPVLLDIAAGIPTEQIIDTFSDDWEEIDARMARSGKFFALRVNGDSMSPRILKGDVVIVRQQSDVENGETAIVAVGNETATCKKIKKMQDGLMLISLNPAYAPMIYTLEEIEQLPVKILGKVVELRCKTI